MAIPVRLRRSHILIPVLLLGIARVSLAKRSETDPHGKTIIVRVENVAALRPGDLHFATDRAAEVFARIGVEIRFIDPLQVVSAGLRPVFTVVIANADAAPGDASLYIDALGVARPTVRRAHVFYDRIAALNARSPRPIPTILGDVIAHELGHLMLSSRAHAMEGIMRAGVDMKEVTATTFTKSQAREILARVRELSE